MRGMLLLSLLALSGSAAAEPLIVDNGRLFITAKINGVQTEALLDSGAEATLVDAALAKQAKFGPGKPMQMKGSGGEEQVSVVSGVTIEALGQTIPPTDVVVMDMADLSTRLIKRPTKAIIGREVFDAAPIRIDLANGDVRALGKADTPSGTRLPLTTQGGIETVPVTLGSTSVQAVLDFGNGTGVMIGKELAAQLGLKPVGSMIGGGIGGAIQRDVVVLPELTLAGRTFKNVEASVDTTSSRAELNVGTPILKYFVVTADFKGRAAWFAPAEESKN